MTIQEFRKLPLGTRVIWVSDGTIGRVAAKSDEPTSLRWIAWEGLGFDARTYGEDWALENIQIYEEPKP